MVLLVVRLVGAVVLAGGIWAMLCWPKYLRSRVAIVAFIWFAVCYVISSGLLIAGHRLSEDIELPIGRICGAGEDTHGRLYLGSAEFSRIQIYGPDGTFIGSRFIPDRSYFRFRLEGDTLRVFASGGRSEYVYDANGELIAERVLGKEEFWAATADWDDEIYSNSVYSFPVPYFETADGQKHFPGGLLLLFAFPWPAMFSAYAGGLLAIVVFIKNKRARSEGGDGDVKATDK